MTAPSHPVPILPRPLNLDPGCPGCCHTTCPQPQLHTTCLGPTEPLNLLLDWRSHRGRVLGEMGGPLSQVPKAAITTWGVLKQQTAILLQFWSSAMACLVSLQSPHVEARTPRRRYVKTGLCGIQVQMRSREWGPHNGISALLRRLARELAACHSC